MAEVWPVKFTARDREVFTAWLAKCKEAGAARNMNDAIRLAVQIASAVPADQLSKIGAGRQ